MGKFNTKSRFLIVDPDPNDCKTIKETLRCLDIEGVDEANNGDDALSKLEKNKYDCILIDWDMQEGYGLELIKIIRKKDGPNQEVPILMVTFFADEKKLTTSIKAGAKGFIVKPFSAAVLETNVKRIINEEGERLFPDGKEGK